MNQHIASAIDWGKSLCETVSGSAKLDAELLLADCLGKPRSYLYSWPDQPLEKEVWQRYEALIARRIEPTPIAYLLGEREFYSLAFHTTPDCLIPRPETELLVDAALELCPSTGQLLELGTGSGAIAVAIKLQRPQLRLLATDISPACLALAQKNAARHGTSIDWLESDWFSQIERSLCFDLIASNPPYIAAADPCLQQGDLPAEPLGALSPGASGLEALELIIAGAPDFLTPGGYLLLEHGFEQAPDVASLMAARGFERIECRLDMHGLPRLSLARIG